MNIDPSQIKADSADWELFEVTPHYRRYRLWLNEDSFIQRTDYLGEEEIIRDNARLRDEKEGKSWGDGDVVGRIPLNVYFKDIAPYVKSGDRDHLKWWLNHPDNQWARTRKGKI